MTINQYQPLRPTEGLHYRTHIDHPDSNYDPYEEKNRVAQVKLYQFSYEELFPTQVAIGELFDYLFVDYPKVTKRQMGRTVIQALAYNPRVLKGKSKNFPKPVSTYVISDPLELRYGLEWMLSMWLWRVEDSPVKNAETCREILREVGSQGPDGVFWAETAADPAPWEKGNEPNPLGIDWRRIWDERNWQREIRQKTRTVSEQRPSPPRDLSK